MKKTINYLKLLRKQNFSKIEDEFNFTETDSSRLVFSKFEHLKGKLPEHQSGCSYNMQNNVLRLGQINEHAIAEIKGLHLSDLAIFAKFRIVEFGDDSNSWLGIQFRGYRQATLGGYVIYLRANGSLELFDPAYRVTKIAQLRSDTSMWAEMLFLAYKHTLEVHIASTGEEIISFRKQNLSFMSKGWVSFQTYRTISEFESCTLWSIPAISTNK